MVDPAGEVEGPVRIVVAGEGSGVAAEEHHHMSRGLNLPGEVADIHSSSIEFIIVS